VYETDADLESRQDLLDTSYARAGEHLRGIWGEESRLDARGLAAELPGVQVLDLATVNPAGEPRVAPVDGFFYRGRFWFGSSPYSFRFRNIRRNPAVSGSITKGLETFLFLVHGTAVEIDPRGPEAEGFARYPREVYDFDWDTAHPEAPYARIAARTVLAFKRADA
jgi:Pyridoxamine 5'-phosphate oxidase